MDGRKTRMNINESNALHIHQPSANVAIVTTYYATPQTRGYVTHDKYIYLGERAKEHVSPYFRW